MEDGWILYDNRRYAGYKKKAKGSVEAEAEFSRNKKLTSTGSGRMPIGR